MDNRRKGLWGARHRGLWVGAVVSLAVHLGALAILGLARFSPPAPPMQADPSRVQVALIRSTRTISPMRPSAAATPTVRRHITPAPPAASAAAPTPLPAPGAAVPGQVATGNQGTAPAPGFPEGGLRGLAGCDHANRDERERCSDRLGALRLQNIPPVDAIPAEKRAYYAAIQRQYQMIHHYETPVAARARGALGPAEDDGALIRGQMGGHGPGMGCGLAFGSLKTKRGKKADTSVKATGFLGLNLGPVRCGVMLPQGMGSEEMGAPPP